MMLTMMTIMTIMSIVTIIIILDNDQCWPILSSILSNPTETTWLKSLMVFLKLDDLFMLIGISPGMPFQNVFYDNLTGILLKI